jgi:hypothetical protein
MTMLYRVQRLLVLCIVALPLLVAAAPQTKPAPTAAQSPAQDLQQQLEQILEQRTEALNQLAARYAVAPLDQRSAIEAEAQSMLEEYELDYLIRLVDYHRLTGNVEELARAERQLASLQQRVAAPQQSSQKITGPSGPAGSKKE